jgi:3-deoxy-D-manno-octulosonic-acid transferase
MRLLYQIFIQLYGFLTSAYALFNHKARLMCRGRKQTFKILKSKIQPQDRVIWIHCASLGEFEQGRVLLEQLKKQYTDRKILLSFFSPSGYEIRKNYPLADIVVYLPNDTPKNARHFVKLANPELTFFIKYEFWYNYLAALEGRQIFQVSLILRYEHYLLKPYSAWFRKQLRVFRHFFVQNEQTADILKSININCFTFCGDTRFDRVRQIASEAKTFPLIDKFIRDRKVLLLGSSWQKDEDILFNSHLAETMPVIIAPHCIEENHISFIQRLFPQSLLYTQLNEENVTKTDIIIINCIGLLSSLYNYCYLAYIGGGFGAGIHNVLEAACFGKPICFGPNHGKFQEALDLIKLQGGKSISNSSDLCQFVNLMLSESEYAKASNVCSNYVNTRAGATQKIMDYLKTNDL